MTGPDQNLRRLMRADTDRGLGGAFQQSSPAATESDDAEQTFLIAQGDTEYEIEALDSEDYGGRTVEEFYGYGDGDGASANTPNGMEEAELSQLFFYDGPETTSLVVIHDEPNTGDGGSVTMKFAPLPREGEWAVPDDPWDVGYEDWRVTWNWFPCCTDGGVYKGGFETPFWTETFADFREGIDSEEYGEPWVAVDGSGGGLERLPLDPNEPVVTASAGVSNISVDDPQYEIKSSGKFCVSVDPDQNVCVSRKPVLQLGRRECTDVGGQTPPLASVNVNYVEEQETEDDVTVTFERNFWVGSELNGDPCIWYGEEELGICAKLEGCRAPPRPNADGVPEPDAVMDFGSDLVNEISESIPEIPLPEGKDILGIALAIVGVGLMVFGSPLEAPIAVTITGITIVVTNDEDDEDDNDDEKGG